MKIFTTFKSLALFIGLSLFFAANVRAQTKMDRNLRAYYYTKQFEEQLTRLVEINEPATVNEVPYVCPYAKVSRREWDKLIQRFETTDEIFDSLFSISNNFDHLVDDYKDSKEYLLKSAQVKITILCIYNRACDYVDYRKKGEELVLMEVGDNTANKQKLLERIIVWDKIAASTRRNIKINLQALEAIDPGNFDMRLLKAIYLYLDGNKDKAVAELKKLATENDQKSLDDKRTKDKFTLAIRSWLAYIDLMGGHLSSAGQELDQLRELILSKNQYLNDWVMNGYQAMFNIKNKGHEWANVLLNLPVEQVSETHRQTLWAKPDPKHPETMGVKEFKSYRENVSLVPEVLFGQTKQIWDSIQASEQGLIEKNMHELRDDKKNYATFFVPLSSLSGSKRKLQMPLHIKRYQLIERQLIKLVNLRKGWDILIEKNPEINLHKIYRIKTNLAFFYLAQHKDEILEFFKYYKPLKSDEYESDAWTILEANFKTDFKNLIDNDLKYIEEHNPEHLSTLFIKAEKMAYMDDPQDAEAKIKAMKESLPETASCYGMNANDMMKYYLAIVAFRQGPSAYAKMLEETVELSKQNVLFQQLENLKTINNTQVQITLKNNKKSNHKKSNHE